MQTREDISDSVLLMMGPEAETQAELFLLMLT